MADFTGLIREDPEVLADMQKDYMSLEGVRCAPEREARLAKVPSWVAFDDQMRMNSCVGHGLTTALEKVIYMKTRTPTQLSRLYAYRMAQAETGIRSDSGAQLSGALKASLKGICREAVFPYGPYNTPITQAAKDDAKKWVVVGHIKVPNYQSWRTALGGNIAGIMTASSWPIEVDRNGYARRYHPMGRGGHCYAAMFLADTADANGRPDVWMVNSHLGNFTFKVSATFVDQLVGQNPYESVGFTDMEVPVPRPINWLEDNPWYLKKGQRS